MTEIGIVSFACDVTSFGIILFFLAQFSRRTLKKININFLPLAWHVLNILLSLPLLALLIMMLVATQVRWFYALMNPVLTKDEHNQSHHHIIRLMVFVFLGVNYIFATSITRFIHQYSSTKTENVSSNFIEV